MQRRACEALSSIELQVLTLAARGFSDGQIVKQLHMGRGSAKGVLRRVYRKLGATGRANAVHLAYQKGVLTVCRLCPEA